METSEVTVEKVCAGTKPPKLPDGASGETTTYAAKVAQKWFDMCVANGS